MSIPFELQPLVTKIYNEIDEIAQETTKGLSVINSLLFYFPNNLRLIRYLSLFNNTILFIDITRRRIEANIERISAVDVTSEEIQEAGEDISTLLGRIIEAKIEIQQAVTILENLS
ncbi:MAG: restriction endonuclease subunit S [Microcystaceae cyanobacterium]